MRTGAMFKDINPLPGSQRKIAIIHGDGEAGIGQHGADVGGCIVGSFKIVRVPTVPFRNEAFHKCFKVGAGSWVPILADDKRGTRMLDE